MRKFLQMSLEYNYKKSLAEKIEKVLHMSLSKSLTENIEIF
jgi:hypothetical protein